MVALQISTSQGPCFLQLSRTLSLQVFSYFQPAGADNAGCHAKRK
jgi:hypothetical protein